MIERANATQYGLAAGVVTKDINKAMTVVNRVGAGTVWCAISGVLLSVASNLSDFKL